MKILVCTTLDLAQQHQLINGLGEEHEVFFKSGLGEEGFIQEFASAHILLGNLPLEFWSFPHPNLEFWQLDSAGFDQYQSLELNIRVANMGSFYAQRCAETIVAGLIGFYRGIPSLVRLQIQKTWLGSKIRPQLQGLTDKNVVILGAGAIALAAKRMLAGFGCNITLTARQSDKAEIHDLEELLKVLPNMDVVINTLPGSAVNYVNERFIQSMKAGSVYANVGRGNTTDETALINALTTGKISGAILDVTQIEPVPMESKLWEMEQVILTQHSGGGDQNEMTGKVKHFIKNVKRFQENLQPDDLIDLRRGY
jgi:glyoxylate/hydroxypyruvate reductase A